MGICRIEINVLEPGTGNAVFCGIFYNTKREVDLDYRKYQLNRKEQFFCLILSMAVGLLTAQLFYRSMYGLIVVPLLFPVIHRLYKKEMHRKQKERLLEGFREAMQSVSAALLAGYSMENAWSEAEKELEKLDIKGSYMLSEIHRINIKVQMNQPLEQALAEFAERSGCEEIESFSEVFLFAKRSGGDFTGIIRTTVGRLNAKMEVEREIDTVIAGKRLEGRIMSVMPAALLLYLNISSGDFLNPLYRNPVGICVMTVALFLYIAAMLWSEKIADIRI